MAKRSSTKINWIEGLIVKTFGLTRVYESFPLLEAWLNIENDLSPKDIEELEYRRNQLIRNINLWNEETLKMNFIAFILDMIRFQDTPFAGIFDAELSGIVQNERLHVVPDYTLAKVTIDLIEQPYFYFHEYKQSKKNKDPIAQILLAMLIAQTKNENPVPLYGCAVVGENWYFMVLDGKNYSVSTAFVSTNSDGLQNILLILRKFKHILLTELAREYSVN